MISLFLPGKQKVYQRRQASEMPEDVYRRVPTRAGNPNRGEVVAGFGQSLQKDDKLQPGARSRSISQGLRGSTGPRLPHQKGQATGGHKKKAPGWAGRGQPQAVEAQPHGLSGYIL